MELIGGPVDVAEIGQRIAFITRPGRRADPGGRDHVTGVIGTTGRLGNAVIERLLNRLPATGAGATVRDSTWHATWQIAAGGRRSGARRVEVGLEVLRH
ncbi:hypothetical protein AB0H12_30495 [Actinosynnema sp. NPDC023794]